MTEKSLWVAAGLDLHLSKMTFEDVTPTPLSNKLFQNQPNPVLNSAFW
jgi:hypothetical protein